MDIVPENLEAYFKTFGVTQNLPRFHAVNPA